MRKLFGGKHNVHACAILFKQKVNDKRIKWRSSFPFFTCFMINSHNTIPFIVRLGTWLWHLNLILSTDTFYCVCTYSFWTGFRCYNHGITYTVKLRHLFFHFVEFTILGFTFDGIDISHWVLWKWQNDKLKRLNQWNTGKKTIRYWIFCRNLLIGAIDYTDLILYSST